MMTSLHHRLFLTLAAVLTLAGGCSHRASEPPLYLGHLAPRSGPQREYGLRTEQALLLAVEQLRAANEPLAGRFLAVLHADTHGNAETAHSQAVRLLQINEAIALIGGPDPTLEQRLCRVAQQLQRPLLTLAWLPAPTLAPYGFSLGPVPADQGRTLARFTLDYLQCERIAILLDNRCAACVALAEAFTDTVDAKVPVKCSEFASTDSLAELGRRTMMAKPDAVLLACRGADLEKLYGALQGAGLLPSVPLLVGGPEDGSLFNLPERSEWYWSTLFVTENERPQTRDFVHKFQKRFQRLPGAAEALAYDAFSVLVEAIRRAKTFQGEKLRETLAELKDFDGVSGPITFAQGQAAGRPLYVVRRQEGQVKKVWEPGKKK